jgi:hypothetical protein
MIFMVGSCHFVKPFLACSFFPLPGYSSLFLKIWSVLGTATNYQMEGFEAFEGRRKRKHDKQIDSNVMINSRGFDEGIDLHIITPS